VGREKSYADMTDLEQGDSLNCQMPIPLELAQSEWVIFKIAQNSATGAIFIEKESVVPSGRSIRVRARWRGDEFHHDIVLAHPKTGTILVWK
jgi:hypothetical protein